MIVILILLSSFASGVLGGFIGQLAFEGLSNRLAARRYQRFCREQGIHPLRTTGQWQPVGKGWMQQ